MTNKTVNKLMKIFTDGELISRSLTVCENDFTLLFIDGLANIDSINLSVVAPLIKCNTAINNYDDLLGKVIFNCNSQTVTDTEQMKSQLLIGNSLLFMNNELNAIKIETLNTSSRAISESPTSGVTKGPREGFVENAKLNLTLIRRRLKTPDLVVNNISVGKYTSTNVVVCYISSIADDKTAEKVIERIKQINTDGILDSSYISRYLDERKTKIFKTVGASEKPDIVASKLLEGRIAIIVDGSPIVLTVPYMFIEDLQSPEDYYETNETATLARFLRIISVVVAIILPGIFISLQIHNYQIIPSKFLITIINSTQGIPFTPMFEMLLVLTLFDLLREANGRMPKIAGLSLSVVGAIVLGDAAVKAGLLSAPSVVIAALSGIGLYAMPDNTLVFSLLRVGVTVVGGVMGMYGMVLVVLFILLYMTTLGNYNVPYLAPFAPSIPQDKQDAIIVKSVNDMEFRPRVLGSKNKRRRVKIVSNNMTDDDIK